MSLPKYPELFSCLLILISIIFPLYTFHTCYGDVGAAGHYTSPYVPTDCYSEDTTEFPSNKLFAAAGDEIWDNGAACGRQYVVRCISAAQPIACANSSTTIQVKIVDYANSAVSHPVVTSGTTMLLSDMAFQILVNGSLTITSTSNTTASINIEFKQV